MIRAGHAGDDSVVNDQGGDGAAVVLSGTGSDGSRRLLAVKRAVLSARADAGVDGWFELDAPATVARVREACATPRDQLRM